MSKGLSTLEVVRRLLRPRSIAVIGASPTPGKVGYATVKNLLDGGYRGRIYPINPKAPEILSLKAYRSVKEVPDEIDLALIAIPAKLVPGLLMELGEKGVPGAVIFSSGFAEIGNYELDKQLREAIKKSGVRVIGPNTFGIYNPHMKMSAAFTIPYDYAGGIALTCQSGGVGMGVLGYARSRRLGLSALIGFGNKVDLDETDVLEYFAEDEKTKVIAMHMESIKNGRRFIEVLKKVTKVKPVVVLKAGRTNYGVRAAKSHTGAIIGADEVVDAALRKAGAIRVRGLEELFDTARALAMLPKPRGDNVIVVTGAGGLGVILSDAIADHGLKLMEVPEDLKEKFRKYVPEFGALGNPIDITGASPPETYRETILTAVKDPRVHAVILGYWHTVITPPKEFAKAVIDAVKEMRESGIEKPVVACLSGDVEVEEAAKILEEHGVLAFPYSPERTVAALAAVYRYKWYTERISGGQQSGGPYRR